MRFSCQILSKGWLSSHIAKSFATIQTGSRAADHTALQQCNRVLTAATAMAVLAMALVPVAHSDELNLPDFEALVAEVGPAVVKITSSGRQNDANPSQSLPNFNEEDMPDFFRRFFENMPDFPGSPSQDGPSAGFGSGFVYSSDGYIITNAHVVDKATKVIVSLPDQREFDATIVGSDERSDIALLKIDASGLPVLRLGDSSKLTVGSWVLAIGSPFGFEYSATQGIVSALSRSLPDESYVPFIQTDAAVNPGNSGGPLFNTRGEVIGVNAQIYSRSGGYMGLSFAIPINVVKSIAEQLREGGSVRRGWLGVLIQGIDQQLARSFGLDKPAGALVARVTEGSPAAAAGLRSGDIILGFDGTEISRSGELPAMVGNTPVGSTVALSVFRNGETITIDVTLSELAGDGTGAGEDPSSPPLGLTLEPLTREQRRQLDVESGATITAIKDDSPARLAGMMKGDVLVTFNREPVNSASDLQQQLQQLSTGNIVPVLLIREGKPLFIAYAME